MDHKLMNGNQCLNDNEKRKSYVGVFIRQLVEAEAAKYDIAYTPEDFAEAYGRRLGEWTEEDTNRSGEFITEEENRNSVETAEEAKADLWRFLHVPENIVPMVSSYAGFRKLRAGEYGKEEPSGLSDDEIIRKAGADGYGERSPGSRFNALWTADPRTIGRDVFGSIFDLLTILAFWSGRCAGQMAHVFKQSGLSAPELYEYFGNEIADDLARIACAYVSDRPVYRKPEKLSSTGQDQNEIIVNTGNGFAMLGDYHPEENPRYGWNDIGIANLFADIYKDTVRYCTDRKRWYVYDGKRWAADDGAAKECCKELVLALQDYSKCFDELSKEDGEKELTYQEYVKKYLTRHGREKILKDASSVHPVTSDKFDKDPWMFNCLNGTYHLSEKRFTGHRPADMLTKLSGVRYNRHSRCERWERHIDEVAEHDGTNDAELAKYIRKCLGYALTGDTKYECAFVFYGPTGRNGKSLTLDTYLKMLGDYGRSTNPETIARSRSANGSGPTENIARLAGVRFVSISEPDKSMKMSEAMIKTLTGNDRIVARRLNEGSVEFYPQFKIFINSNYRPFVSDKTVFSRLKIIPFDHRFEEKDQDKSLKEEFAEPENLSGIFNWCLAGLELLEEDGGFDNEPEAVKKAREFYMEDNDFIGRFFKDTFELDEKGMVHKPKTYEKFEAWCAKNKEDKISRRAFYQAMETIPGIKPDRARFNDGDSKNPLPCFKGLRWRGGTGEKETNQATETERQ